MEGSSPGRSYASRISLTTSYLLLIPVVSIALLLRLHSLEYITESLWYEDGLFITQSYDMGIKSVWTPFDYIFVYHRLVALIAKQAPLIVAPYIFFFGWLFSYLLIVWVIRNRSKLIRLDALSVLLLILAITLQPSHGEPWFNLNQTHFTLGIALCIYVCIPAQKPASVPEILFLLIASLSGVNSIVLTAILALQLFILKDFFIRKAIYILVPVGALIEALFLFESHRVQHTGIDLDPLDWLHAISTLLYFGGTSTLIYVTSTLFWMITLACFGKWIVYKKERSDRILWLSPLFAAITAALMFFVGAVAMGKELPLLNPMDMASRYFLIPYSLIFFVAFICSKDRKALQVAVAGLAGIICAAEFSTVDRSDRGASTGLLAYRNMQWTAYAKFQKIKPNLVIPINSPVPIYPPDPYVQIAKNGVEDSVRTGVRAKSITLDPQSNVEMVAPARSDDAPSIRHADVHTPMLPFDISNHCVTNRYLALEVDIWRERMGSAKVYWGKSLNVSPDKSLERFYPAGFVTMQFAFHREVSDSVIGFYPALGVRDSPVVRTLAKYMQEAKEASTPFDPKITVAALTPSGGQFKIKAVRLFCLE